MKISISLLLVAAVAAVSYGALVPKATSRTNFYHGQPGPEDRRFTSYIFYSSPSFFPNRYEMSFSWTTPVNITAVWVLEVGAGQFSEVSILSGGLGQDHVTVQLRSVPGYEFHCDIQIYGQY